MQLKNGISVLKHMVLQVIDGQHLCLYSEMVYDNILEYVSFVNSLFWKLLQYLQKNCFVNLQTANYSTLYSQLHIFVCYLLLNIENTERKIFNILSWKMLIKQVQTLKRGNIAVMCWQPKKKKVKNWVWMIEGLSNI